MSEPTLGQVFGPNASQDAATVTISKADLAPYGLTPDAANNAEGVLAALLLCAAVPLSAENILANPDQHVTIQIGGSTVWDSAYGTKLRQNLLITFDNDFTNPGIQPDTY